MENVEGGVMGPVVNDVQYNKVTINLIIFEVTISGSIFLIICDDYIFFFFFVLDLELH